MSFSRTENQGSAAISCSCVVGCGMSRKLQSIKKESSS